MTQYDPYITTPGRGPRHSVTLQKKETFFRQFRWVLFCILVGIFVAGAGGLYLIYTKGSLPKNPGSSSIPFIASQGPFKEKPAHPGGSKVLHQDKEIYTFLLDGSSEKESPETLLGDGPEGPLMMEEETPQADSPALPPLTPIVSIVPPPPVSAQKETDPPKLSRAPDPAAVSKTLAEKKSGYALRLMRCATKSICQRELKKLMHQSAKLFSKIPLSMEKEPSGKLMLCVGPFDSEQKALATQSVLLKQNISSTLLTPPKKGAP